MKIQKRIIWILCAVLPALVLQAQKITLTKGNQAPFTMIKGTENINLTIGGNQYYFLKYYKNGLMNYYLLSFDSNGKISCNKNLEINNGVFNNMYTIKNVLSLGDKGYAMIEHLEKATGKNTLLARTIDVSGNVSKDEKEVMNIPFEKMLNSGVNYLSVSPDSKILAVAGEMPFSKEQPAKFKVALFDQALQKIAENEITLPGENSRGNDISMVVGNDKTLYLVKKKLTRNGDIGLTVYQCSATDAGVIKEYAITLTPPNQIFNYTYALNSNNELILSGLYYERRTVSIGEAKAAGIFYFTNKGMNEKLFKTFPLDAPVDNLTARKILVNGNTIFLTTEQFKEQKESAPATTLDDNYNYTHKSDFVIGLDQEGNKKFQIELAKDFAARNFDRQYYSGYFLTNGKLTVIYNDQGKKYIPNYSYNEIPVVVQITNDGLAQAPVVFKNELKLESDYTLFPSFAVQDSQGQIYSLVYNGQFMKALTIKIE